MNKLVIVALVLSLVAGCKKKNTEEETTDPVPPPVAAPQAPVLFINVPADAEAVLMSSLIPHEFTNSYVTQLGKASAFFYTAPGNYNYLDAGIVKCNDSSLVKQSGGSYLFNGKPINGQPLSGINYSSGSTWTVTGNGSVPGFSFTNSTFPSASALTSATVISKSSPYNLSFTSPTAADSVTILLGCDSVLQKKTVVASAGVCNFSAAEIASIKKAGSTNFGYITFMSYKMFLNIVSSKKYYIFHVNNSTYRINITP